MTRQELFKRILEKGSFLCVGLDPDLAKMPAALQGDLLAFNKAIIDATAPHAVAFKPNLAFYEVQGAKGYHAFEETVRYIRENYPDIFIIADAKRGDIGNTSRAYAHSFFETLGVDALTVAPYMGRDSVEPFMQYAGKWTVVLALTSNPGSADFQQITDTEGTPLFERVLTSVSQWGTADNTMFVVGATRGQMFEQVRRIAPNHFLLVPGVGAQGGSLDEVVKYGMNDLCGLLVNSSRGIIHASSHDDFAIQAEVKAGQLHAQMKEILDARFASKS
ncbi:MAG: orotidine-5'-phosphate decarboxylase [Muribaculaceae bacterium]|nr:orotidine-5'-phosphate decarboxylase [Muribaculaceae bacterium]